MEAGGRRDRGRTIIGSTLPKLATLPLPQTLRVRVPEGYAYCGLYAEAYLEAAESFWNDAYPRKTTCLGIRSIGTSLSAVVAAALEERGCPTEWGLDRPMQNYLIGEYRLVAHDDALPQRLPFYTIAYPAHRAGYASLAVEVLGPHTPDGARFKTLVAFYTAQLQQELSRL